MNRLEVINIVREKLERVYGTYCPECKMVVTFQEFETFDPVGRIGEKKRRCFNCHHVSLVETTHYGR